jgi:fibronectin type 3 domain-containing protein
VTQSFSGTGTPNVLLSWTASPTPNVSYNVYRCTISATACVQSSPANFTRIASALAALTYTDLDPSLTAGQTYYYAVTAMDATNNESTFSQVASAIIP